MNQNNSNGIGIRIQNNSALADILKDIIRRAQGDGKKFYGVDYQDAYKTMIASLQTIITLVEITEGRTAQQNQQNNQRPQ